MSNAQADFYRQNGYLVVPDLFTAAEIQELKAETARIFRGSAGLSKVCWRSRRK